MRVVVAPAAPRTGQATIAALLQDPSSPEVVGVYRDPAKAPSSYLSNPRFRAIKGDVGDESSLDFTNADVLVTISPPIYSGSPDPITAATQNAQNVVKAVKKAGSVKRIVYVSSIGAQFERGTGEIGANYAGETVLRGAAPEVIFVRNAYFMHNWNLPTLQGDQPFIYSSISPAEYKIPMVAVKDIGETCAAQAVRSSKIPESPYAFTLCGPEDYSTNDVQKALTEVLGKDVRAEVVPKEGLPGFFAAVFPENVAKLFVEMTESFLPGGVLDASKPIEGKVERGKVGLVEAFRDMLSS